ncbi:TPA: acyltransferase family protein [Klebsiella quasipneumoniae subsp. quasipneumoniae]|uniref:acyltransferase family protein n=1 Tax=Klebsiella quasipneumoniae TaxID=1463165 RepID=UPI003CF95724
MQNAARNEWVDYAKGFGIVLVVYGHISRGLYNSGILSDTKWFHFIDSLIYSFHMPLFFFLSGLFLMKSFLVRGLRIFIFNKVDTILFPYVIWSIIQGLTEFFLSKYTNGNVSLSDVFGLLLHPRAQFWFLYSLFLNFILISLILSLKETLKINITFVIVFSFLFSIFIYLFFSNIPDTNPLNYIVHNSVFILSGVVFSFYRLDIKIQKNTVLFMTIFIVFFIFQSICIFENEMGFKFNSLALIFSLIGTGVITASCISLSKLKTVFIKNVLSFLGRYSMPIYLMHVLVGSGVRIFMSKIFGVYNVGIHLFLGIILGILLPVLFFKFLEKMHINLFSLNGIFSLENLFSRKRSSI